ncbi:unnamed protein product [Mytilus coruscus]|uniref:Uncharacterized protein n=1 Tax=Mytilus coruscus TaxID=42192 RepID=A0A6J8A0B5_MYTCO|nr:unnamed protein product [Mytilus coruscus]
MEEQAVKANTLSKSIQLGTQNVRHVGQRLQPGNISVPIHDIAQSLGPLKSRILPIFHAFTGCDTVSSSAGRGKKTAWYTWNDFPEVSAAFRKMTDHSSTICRVSILPLLERYVVLLYHRTSESNSVNEARKVLFAHKGSSIESVPPTREALYQHAKRSVYQAGLILIQFLLLHPVLPSPDLYAGRSKAGVLKGGPFSNISELAAGLSINPSWMTRLFTMHCMMEAPRAERFKGRSNRHIDKKYELLNPDVKMFDKGEDIVADRGIMVQEIFTCQDVLVNTPTFFKRKSPTRYKRSG